MSEAAGALAAGARGIVSSTRLVANDISMVEQAVRQGLGLAFLPDFSVREDLASGLLLQVLVEEVGLTMDVQAVWPAGRHAAPETMALVNFLAQRRW